MIAAIVLRASGARFAGLKRRSSARRSIAHGVLSALPPPARYDNHVHRIPIADLT